MRRHGGALPRPTAVPGFFAADHKVEAPLSARRDLEKLLSPPSRSGQTYRTLRSPAQIVNLKRERAS